MIMKNSKDSKSNYNNSCSNDNNKGVKVVYICTIRPTIRIAKIFLYC